jgi:hypothetical protein
MLEHLSSVIKLQPLLEVHGKSYRPSTQLKQMLKLCLEINRTPWEHTFQPRSDESDKVKNWFHASKKSNCRNRTQKQSEQKNCEGIDWPGEVINEGAHHANRPSLFDVSIINDECISIYLSTNSDCEVNVPRALSTERRFVRWREKCSTEMIEGSFPFNFYFLLRGPAVCLFSFCRPSNTQSLITFIDRE